ncbi:MAG: HDIG domain-containing protein [Armatimonadetes bacterium]|nr:HDIG domain-containing protein [Armatimonadota bacterium]
MAKALPALTPSSTNPFGRGPRRRARREGRPRRLALPAAPDGRRIALVALTILTLSALLSLHFLPDRVSLSPGQVSDQDVRAARTVQYVDEGATDALRAEAEAQVPPVYEPVPHAASDAAQRVKEAYDQLRQRRRAGDDNPDRVNGQLRQQVGIGVEPASLLVPLLRPAASDRHLDQAERLTAQVVDDAMGREIRADRPGDLAEARDTATARLAASPLPKMIVPAVAALARAAIQANAEVNPRATDKARQEAQRLVAPVTATVFAGDIVVRRGEAATPAVLAKLRALGLQNPRLDPGTVAGVTLLVALMTGMVGVYLARYFRSVYASDKLLLLLSLLAALSVLGLRLGGVMLGARLPDAQFGYICMLCVATAGMLIAALIHPRLALLIAALLAAQSGLILGNGMRFSLMTLLSSLAAIYAVSDIRSRGDVLRAGALLGATNALLCAAVGRIEGDSGADILRLLPWAFTTGLVSVALFWLLAALFERPFGITTHLGLLELSDPNRPLLQELRRLAPGTYTHSMMVSDLAVAAAEAIGADALLCRVGAYYHDLGKMRKPHYFLENQTGDNVHERLNPSLSALVVAAHVKDGLEIAEQEKLPPVIKQFITEHHGTSLIRYFYYQQTGGDDSEAAPGLEGHFRYGGPRPQSRETGILMLADGVEAASRALDKPTPGRIADTVDKIFAAQLADGQLDECDLTLRDLRGIREAFLRLLTGMLHARIEYPEMLKTDKNGIVDSPADRLPAVAGRAADSDGADAGSAAA